MATIRVRRLDENYDPVYGQGQADFVTDLDAMVQIIKSMLLLFQGEWWEDTTNGTPMFQSILGASGRSIRAVNGLLQKRILSVPYVTKIVNLTSSYSSSRQFSIVVVVETQFGLAQVSNT